MNAFERELEETMANDPELRKPPLFVAASKPEAPTAPPKVNVATDIEAFMAKSANMYDGQRKMLLDLEAAYDTERSRIVDDFRRRMDNLQHEAVEAVRACDASHGKVIGDAKRILASLARMRSEA